jgi:hypothetical protein
MDKLLCLLEFAESSHAFCFGVWTDEEERGQSNIKLAILWGLDTPMNPEDK